AAILGSCVVFLDSSVVGVALPRIGRELPAHLFGILEGQSYVYNGYLLAESALLILAGGLTDFYGRRRMFSFGVLGFGAASILGGLAPTMEWLVAFRALQGVAGAFIIPGSLALITATFTGEEQVDARAHERIQAAKAPQGGRVVSADPLWRKCRHVTPEAEA